MDMSQKSDTTKMRRADRAIPREVRLRSLTAALTAHFPLLRRDGTPYAVALNVVRDGEKLFSTARWRG